MDVVMQTISLIGAALVLVAFLGLQRRWWNAENRRYLWYNFFGAALLAEVGIWDRRAGFIVLEGIWAAVSAMSLLRPRKAA